MIDLDVVVVVPGLAGAVPDLDEADTTFDETAGERTLIHCAANFRVTAFYSLYAQKHLGWSEGQAEALRARIWAGSDYPVWEAFIARQRAALSG